MTLPNAQLKYPRVVFVGSIIDRYPISAGSLTTWMDN